MRRQATLGALLLIGIGLVLGATVFRADIAQATGLAQHVNATIDSPLDAQGNVKVHEQGTPNVNVTNTSLAVTQPAVTGGSFREVLPAGTSDQLHAAVTASAISVTMESGIHGLALEYQGREVTAFAGPAAHGHSPVDLALTRPITFDEVSCDGSTGFCAFTAVGNQP